MNLVGWSWQRPRWIGGACLAAIALALSACDPAPPPTEFTVASTADGHDIAPGDGICEMTAGSGDCSLRAALDEANATSGTGIVHITLAVETSTLTLAGTDDDNQGGDLDLTSDRTVVIEGPTAGARVDANGADHGFEVLAGNLQLRQVAVQGASGSALVVTGGASGVTRSSLHHNGAAGVEVASGASAVLVDSTLAANGGAGLVNEGTVLALSSTVSANGAGGIMGSGTTHVQASIVADQSSGPDCAQTAISSGDNLDSDGSCGLTGSGDQPATDPLLQPLDSALLAARVPGVGSPVIDTRSVGSVRCDGSATDQRGTVRPVGPACDTGAVEVDGSFIVDTAADLPDAAPGDGACITTAGTCSLRAAVTEANQAAGSDVVRLTADPTLTRAGADEDANATGDLDITGDLQILGQGHTLDANALDRAVHVRAADVSVRDLTITGGAAGNSRNGGAILHEGGNLAVVTSTIRDNSTTGSGGGIAFTGDTLSIDASTVSGNIAPATVDELSNIGFGGGLFVPSGTATITRSTFSGNQAGWGGAIQNGFPFFENPDSPVDLRASTVVGNSEPAIQRGEWTYCSRLGCETFRAGLITAVSSAVINPGADCDGVRSSGHNLSSDLTCDFTQSSDTQGTDPLLGALADNGGPTLTHLPAAASPLVDAIPSASCTASTPEDQRDVERPVGPGCDIGSVERTP